MKITSILRFSLPMMGAVFLPFSASGKLNVVATTSDFGSIAETVGGDRVKVSSLARGAEDPHFVTPRPSFIPILNRADVLIDGGAELEIGWLPPLVQTSRNRNILPGRPGRISIAPYIPDMLDVPAGPIDRSMGDVHAAGNPHFMLDPRNGQIVARVLADRFSQLDPEGAEMYSANAENLVREIEKRLVGWKEVLAPFKGTKVVTYHKSHCYLARRFGFDIVDQIEPLPGIEPSPRHITALIASMRGSEISMVWMEPFRPRRTAGRVADQTGARLLLLPEHVGGVEEAKDYISLIDYNVREILAALRD